MDSKIIVAFCLSVSMLVANDDMSFPSDDENMLIKQSFTDNQVKNSSPKFTALSKDEDPIRASLVREANAKRNGYYAMILFNAFPLQRKHNGEVVNMLSSGVGIKGGIISYLDGNIGMRGYFALDVANDALSLAGNRVGYTGTTTMFSLGVDILVDFFMGKSYKNAIGFFLGVGAGAIIYVDTQNPLMIVDGEKSHFAWSGNVTIQSGLSITFLHRHRLEIGARLLPTQSLNIDDNGVVLDFGLFSGYSYKF